MIGIGVKIALTSLLVLVLCLLYERKFSDRFIPALIGVLSAVGVVTGLVMTIWGL